MSNTNDSNSPPSLFDLLANEAARVPAAPDPDPVFDPALDPAADPESDTVVEEGTTDDRFSDTVEPESVEHSQTYSMTPARGLLSLDQRAVMILLLKKGVILHSNKPKQFAILCQSQEAFRNHLADINLTLTLDERGGMAFIRGPGDAVSDDEDDDDAAVSLISGRTLSQYDTLILLIIRRHFQERESTGENRIIIDIDKLESDLVPFLALSNNARQDRKKLNGAIKHMTEKNLLIKVRNNDDRWEISPIIRHVVNAAFLESMLAEYVALAASGKSMGDDNESE